MAEKTADEIKIGEGGAKEPPEGVERVTPDVEADFLGLLKDYGVAEKAAKVITKHIAETGTADVFEDPRQLLERMARFPRYIPPVTRKNILDHWTASRSIPIPEGFDEEAGLSAEELKARTGKGTTPEKYSVETQTGAIKVASTTDKALTWDEAEKLSKEIKKDIEARGSGEKETAFILGENGAWTLNPKAKLGFGEFAVFQMYQDSLRRGEPIDPIEELTKREEQSSRLKQAMGVKTGGEDTEMTMLDKLEKLGMLKKGGEGTTEIELLDKLNQLGMLKKPGEEGAGSQIVKDLQVEIKGLRETLQKQELDTVKSMVSTLSKQLSDLRNDMANQGKLEGRYAILDKTISAIDSQLSGIRSDVKPLVMAAGGGNSGLERKSPVDKATIAKGLKEAIEQEREARQLEDELLFGGKPQD